MLGGADPVFGSRLADAAVSMVLASITLAVLYTGLSRTDSPDGVVSASSVSYILLCGAAYFVPRYVFDAFASGVFAVQYLVWIAVFVVPTMALQAAIPAYLYTARGNVGAIIGLFGAMTYTFWELLGIRGDTDILTVFPFVIFPVSITFVLFAAGIDFAARRVPTRAGVR